MLGLPPAEARRRLAGVKVAVVGLAGPGAHAAAALAACGVGALVLADPGPCRPGDLPLLPPLGPGALGRPRERAVQAAVEAAGGGTAAILGAPALTAEGVAALARGCQLLVACPAEGSAAALVNQASIANHVPALFGEVDGQVALVGPLLLPGRTACHACWLARRAACEADPPPGSAAPPGRAVPPLAAAAGAALALEALKHLLGAGLPTLAGRVRRLDALGWGGELHAVLPVGDCPACSTPPPAGPPPPLERLAGAGGPAGDLLAAAPLLVSPVCGVVTALRPLPKDRGEPAAPHVVGARLAAHPRFDDPDRRLCSGKGLTPDEASAGALGEALERYASVAWPRAAVGHARRDQLRGETLDPCELVLYLPEQYPGLPYAPYRDATRLGWVLARSLASGVPVHVPAVAVLAGYRPASPAERICPPTWTGTASGETLAAAVLAALFEVLERDAFMVSWMNRLPARRVDPSSHPDAEVADLCAAYARRGVTVELYLLAADHSCRVFLALGVQERGDGPAVVAGLGADLDPGRAARKAVLEVGQVRPALRIDLRSPRTRSRVEALVADPRLASGPDDHALLYADRRSAAAFDFLRRGPATGGDWAAPGPASAADRLGMLVAELRSLGGDVLYHDLTPPEVARLGLRTARVLVPGFQPVHFGAGQARLGGRRLYELPHRLGLTPAPTTPATLNPDPHPLA